MTHSRTIGAIAATLAATLLVAAPVAAQRHPHHGKKQICRIERKHGKRIKVCRWVRR